MHQHGHDGLTFYVFLAANLAITAGYLAMPILFLRYLPLTRTVMVFGAGFFLGCMGTHLGISVALLGSPHTGAGSVLGVFWTVEHVVQAVCTWGFIIAFHRMLHAASLRRVGRLGRGGAPRTVGSPP